MPKSSVAFLPQFALGGPPIGAMSVTERRRRSESGPALRLQIQSVAMISLRAGRMSKRWRVAVLVLLLCAIAEAGGVRSWYDQARGMRRPGKNDEFFRYVAQELAEPTLCEKIPWSAREDGGWLIAPSYERSECYDTIAGNTRKASLCLKVKRLGPVSLLSEQTSMSSCLKRAVQGFQSGMAISQGNLAGFFTQMGYDPDTLHLEGITPPVVSVRDIYRQLTDRYGLKVRSQNAGGPVEVIEPGTVDRTVLVKRIETAIGGRGAPTDVRMSDTLDAAYLADMAALVSKDSRWCFRIPADLALASERKGFRSWCVFALARETKDSVLCGRIGVSGGESDPRLSLQAECIREINSPFPSMAHYTPEVPAEDGQIRVLLGLLNVEIPRAKDLPQERIQEAFNRFLDELSRGTDSKHVAARDRFIDRVGALPENN
jgi:hypothetical protein